MGNGEWKLNALYMIHAERRTIYPKVPKELMIYFYIYKLNKTIIIITNDFIRIAKAIKPISLSSRFYLIHHLAIQSFLILTMTTMTIKCQIIWSEIIELLHKICGMYLFVDINPRIHHRVDQSYHRVLITIRMHLTSCMVSLPKLLHSMYLSNHWKPRHASGPYVIDNLNLVSMHLFWYNEVTGDLHFARIKHRYV